MLHLSISSSFAEGAREKERGIIVFCGSCNNNLSCICGIIMTGGSKSGRKRVSQVTLCHVLSSLCPSSACYVLQCSNSLSNAALSIALLSHGGRKGRGEVATLLHHQRYQMQAASSSGATSSSSSSIDIDIGISIDIGTCIIIMIIASCNSKS